MAISERPCQKHAEKCAGSQTLGCLGFRSQDTKQPRILDCCQLSPSGAQEPPRLRLRFGSSRDLTHLYVTEGFKSCKIEYSETAMGRGRDALAECRTDKSKVAPSGMDTEGKSEVWQKRESYRFSESTVTSRSRSTGEIEQAAKHLAQLASEQSVVKLGCHWHKMLGGAPSRWAGCTLDR